MSTILITEIADAIKTTLATASTVKRAMGYSELTENIPDVPLIQVYWNRSEQDASPGSKADRTTFGAGVRNTLIQFYVDYYARARSHIGEDMAALMEGLDAIQIIVEAQDTKPYFGLDGIKAFRWYADRVEFVYGGTNYAGVRFVLTVRTF